MHQTVHQTCPKGISDRACILSAHGSFEFLFDRTTIVTGWWSLNEKCKLSVLTDTSSIFGDTRKPSMTNV